MILSGSSNGFGIDGAGVCTFSQRDFGSWILTLTVICGLEVRKGLAKKRHHVVMSSFLSVFRVLMVGGNVSLWGDSRQSDGTSLF